MRSVEPSARLCGDLWGWKGEGVDLVIVPEYRIERIEVWIRRRDGKVVGGDF